MTFLAGWRLDGALVIDNDFYFYFLWVLIFWNRVLTGMYLCMTRCVH